jgi:hypothetical protein
LDFVNRERSQRRQAKSLALPVHRLTQRGRAAGLLERLDNPSHGSRVDTAIGQHVFERDDHLDGLHLLRATLVAVVAIRALPEDRILYHQLIPKTVEDFQHELPGVELVTVGGGRAVAHASSALVAETRQISFYLFGQFPPEAEINAHHIIFFVAKRFGHPGHSLAEGLFLRCRMLFERHLGQDRSLSSSLSTCS